MKSGLQPVRKRRPINHRSRDPGGDAAGPDRANTVKAHVAAIIALIAANLVAIFLFTMPAGMSLRATVLGAVTGLCPIGWIVLNAIFMYRLTVATGRFEILQRAIGSVTPDRRLQLLLIAFPSAPSSRGPRASARRWRSPARSSSGSAFRRSPPRAYR